MTRQRHRTDCSESGFVLAEALVCVILISLTIGLVAATLTFGRRVADAGQAREQLAHASTGVQVLSDWLSRALPVREGGAGGHLRVLFEGHAGRLTFLTISHGDAQPGGLMAITVTYAGPSRGGLGALVFTASPIAVGTLSPTAAAVEAQVLVGNVTTAQFRYFGAPAEGEANRWAEDWKDTSRLPDLVSLKATLALGPRLETLDLTFRVIAH